MENTLNKNLKMGVDQMKTILNVKRHNMLASDTSNNMGQTGLSEPEIIATKALLDAVLQSAKDIAGILKPTRVDQLKCNGKVEEHGDAKSATANRDRKSSFVVDKTTSLSRQGVVSKAPQKIKTLPHGTVTLTLEPVPQPVSRGNYCWKKSPYYSKVNQNPVLTNSIVKTNPVCEVDDQSAVKKFQDWHTKYVEELAYANAMNAATSKLKAFATASQDAQNFSKLPSTTSNSVVSTVATGPESLQAAGSEDAPAGQKRKYFTISNHYFQYLNRPKQARHDTLRVIFKAQVLLDSDLNTKPCSDTVFPKTFVSWPSGKVPLPGYKIRRPIRRIENHTSKKQKRISTTYRVPKPKPNPLAVGQFRYNNTSRKPLGPILTKAPQERKFFPVERLKWDSVARRYFVHPQQSIAQNKQQNKGQWFSFPSMSKVPGTYSYNINTLKKRFGGSSGATLSSSIRSNLQSQNQNRHLPSPVKLRQNIKEIKVIFKCKTPPQPHWFKKFDDYATMCFIYQIRKAMAARAMRYGYIEGKHDNKPKTETINPVIDDFEIANAASKRLISNYLVLVSAQTEATFTIWSERLPRAKELDAIFDAARKSGNSSAVSSDWVHVCKNDLVEDPPRKEIKDLSIPHENEKLFEDASKAWLYDTLSDPEEPVQPAKTSVTRHTGGPSYTVPSQAGLQNFCNSDSSKSSHNPYNGVVHSKAPHPACSGHGRMQRSLSENISSNQQNVDFQKQNHVLPKPSYCVRFRMCFCTCDCTCLMRDRYFENNSQDFVSHQHYEKVNIAPTTRIENSTQRCLDSSPDSLTNGDDEFYNFSEKPDVPLIVLKSPSPSKWDEQNRRIPNKSVAKIQKSCPKWGNYFHRKGTFVKKIGSTEIYHKWAVRRCSAPEFDSIVEDIEIKKDIKKIGHTEIAHRLAVKIVSPEKSSQSRDCNHGDIEASFSKDVVRRNDVLLRKKQPQEEKCITGETALLDPTEFDMDCVYEVVEEVLIDAEKCDELVLSQSNFREGNCASNEEGKRKTITYPEKCEGVLIQEAPLSKSLYDVDKQLCSSLARRESKAAANAYSGIDNVPRNQTDQKEQCGIPMTDLSRHQLRRSDISSSNTGLVQKAIGDLADEACRHVANLIGPDGSKHKQHVHDSPDKQSLVGLPCCGGVAATGNGNFTAEMGNSFFKPKDECRVSPVLKTNFTRTLVAGAKGKVLPVLANGLLKDIERVDHKIPANVGDCKQDKVGDCKQNKVGDCKQKLEAICGFNEEVGYNAGIDDTLVAEGTACEQNNLSIARGDAKRRTPSDSLGLRTTDDAGSESYKSTRKLKRTRDEEAKLEEKETYLPAESKKRKPSDEECTAKLLNADDEVVFAKDKHIIKKETSKTKIASGEVEIDLPVETRSSRRIRSRVNNKRGRYESDYVSDLPKANKKPKRILPTREYDNDDFWQFYRDCEKTVYSKNLILQNKYIKLLKKKGIRSPISDTQTSLFSNVVCATSSLPTQSQTSQVTDDGLVPFMSRLIKQRKTPPELPQVPEEHCVYCGRSFVGEDKRVFEAHVARHGMRHTMLAAPQVAKKKKTTTRNERGNFVFKRPKPSNKMVVVVDPPKNKTEDDHVKATGSSATVSETSEQPKQLGPLPRPSHLSMGHRKQTARKSFSLASTLSKDKLIAALECKMRAHSTINYDKTQPIPIKSTAGTQNFLPMSITKLSPSKSVAMQSCYSNSHLPKPHSARKTLTGLPITYNHLNRSYIHAITSLNKSAR